MWLLTPLCRRLRRSNAEPLEKYICFCRCAPLPPAAARSCPFAPSPQGLVTLGYSQTPSSRNTGTCREPRLTRAAKPDAPPIVRFKKIYLRQALGLSRFLVPMVSFARGAIKYRHPVIDCLLLSSVFGSAQEVKFIDLTNLQPKTALRFKPGIPLCPPEKKPCVVDGYGGEIVDERVLDLHDPATLSRTVTSMSR